jgi:hypothetical protein
MLLSSKLCLISDGDLVVERNLISNGDRQANWDLALKNPVRWRDARWIGLPVEHFFGGEAADPESWRNLAPLDVSALLKPGDNLICIRAYETDSPDWFISVLRGGMRIDFEDNDGPLLLETDADWQATEVTWPKVFLDKAFTEEKWLEPGFAVALTGGFPAVWRTL